MKIIFQEATENELEALVSMLWNKVLCSKREAPRTPLNPRYIRAFHHIM